MAAEKESKFWNNINWVDLIVVLAILASIAGVWPKYTLARSVTPLSKPDAIRMVFYCDEVPEYSAKQISPGDVVADPDRQVRMGVVADVKMSGSVSYGTDDAGKTVTSSKPGYASVYITVTGPGLLGDGREYSGLTFDNMDYFLGKYLQFRVGNVAMYGYLSEIEAIKE